METYTYEGFVIVVLLGGHSFVYDARPEPEDDSPLIALNFMTEEQSLADAKEWIDGMT